jgi:energy-coupling factor transporter ATP-binding protein EcfA2
MYFKHITLKNVGSIPELKYDFPFASDGNPKPIILVGTNGSGKSTVLSYLLNSLIAAQQAAFDDAEVEKGRVYRLRSPQFIKTGESYSYARVNFGSDFSCYEWQLDRPRENYIEHFDTPEIDISFSEIPLHNSSIFNTNFFNNPVEVSRQFSKNCVLYFPANRFEQPVWVNERNLNAKAEFIDQPKIDRISNRSIIQQSPLISSKNWLLDVILDRSNYDLKTQSVSFPMYNSSTQQNIEVPLNLFHGFQGNSANIAILNELWKNREEEIKEKTWKN